MTKVLGFPLKFVFCFFMMEWPAVICFAILCKKTMLIRRQHFDCSYERAMEFQQHVIDAWENHGSGSWLDIRESHRLMEQLKKKVRGERHAVFPANSLPTFMLENKSSQDGSSNRAPDCPI